LAKRRITQSFEDVLGPSLLERLVGCFLCLAAMNLLAVFITGGYEYTVGPLNVSVRHLRNPLLLLLALAMVKAWLRGNSRGGSVIARLRSPLLLFLGVVLIYNLHDRSILSGDTVPARYLPLSLMRELNFDLDEFPALYAPQVPYYLVQINGHIVSAYPPWAAVLALPVYLLPVLGGLTPQSPLLPDLEKVAATLITAMSVVIFFLALRRLTRESIAWIIAVIYAFGSSSYSTSSQALFQHGPSQLFLCLAIYWLLKGLAMPRFAAYAGLALGSAVICRPSNALLALPIVAYMAVKRRDQLVGFLLATLPPVLLLIGYNMQYFGAPFRTGFIADAIDPSRLWNTAAFLFNTPLSEGLAGVLGSPSRGLFVYSPIFLFSLAGMAIVWGDPQQVFLKYLSFAPLLIILLTAKWMMWWGGHSYGPRILADITPLLCLYLYPLFERAQSPPLLKLKYVIAGLTALSIGLHALGVFGGGDWNGYADVDRHPERLWSWRESPPVYYSGKIGMAAFAQVMGAFAHVKRFALAPPTSREAPQLLAAAYSLEVAPSYSLIGEPVTAVVTVVNTGKAVWLAHTDGTSGEVRLGWVWFKDDREVPSLAGRELLAYDVFPGQRYAFNLRIPTPMESGQYTLELELVSENVMWFSAQGIKRLKVPILMVDSLSSDLVRSQEGQDSGR
jgi:hypothetical protein